MRFFAELILELSEGLRMTIFQGISFLSAEGAAEGLKHLFGELCARYERTSLKGRNEYGGPGLNRTLCHCEERSDEANSAT